MAEKTHDKKTKRVFRRMKKKICSFCADKSCHGIDYKNFRKLRKYTSERAKILPRRVTGTCASHQRELSNAIKRARLLALLPFAVG